MPKQAESWEIAYQLTNAGDGLTVARGKIKDYPSAAEALDRLGERVGTAVAAELRPLADPAPWRLVLTFEVSRQGDPLTVEDLAAQLERGGRRQPNQAAAATGQGGEASGIDLAAEGWGSHPASQPESGF
jgi:hypothetical protein